MINIFRKLFGPAELQGHQHFSKTVPLHTKERIDKHSDICFLQWNLQDQKLNASAGALTLLGFPEGIQPSFTALKDICHPEDVRQVGRMVDAILFKKNFPDFYCRIITPSHNIKHIFITGEIFFDDNSQSIAYVKAILQDVTEQRQHIQKIHMQSRTLEDIAWLQSHKMRSPVATIMGLVQLFNSENLNDPINVKILEGIKEAAGSLDDVIKEITSKTDTMKVAS